MAAGADSLPGWQVLSQLRLQNEQPDLAAESAGKGLKCLAHRHSTGYQYHPAVAAGIVLARAHSLLAQDRLDEAQALFKALTGTPILLVWPRHHQTRASTHVADNGVHVQCIVASLHVGLHLHVYMYLCSFSGWRNGQEVLLGWLWQP